VPLLDAISSLDLSSFEFISVHAPSAFPLEREAEIANDLLGVAERGWPVILHPDAIRAHAEWEKLGDRLCIENMDKRKSAGRDVKELAAVFERLPDASLCFDIAHARQVDPSMTEAFCILKEFRSQIIQVHVSEVNVESRHVRLTRGAVRAYLEVSEMIPPNVPLIIEAPVLHGDIEEEVSHVLEAFGRLPAILS
jgi:hypothetical protein